MFKTALVIMARYPHPGQTKTRLARSLGDVPVAQLYQAFLTDLAQRFADAPRTTLHWAYTPAEIDYPSFVKTLAPGSTRTMYCFPQQGLDFGARLLHAFEWTHSQGFQRTILIGSDSPQISQHIIDQAQEALERVDVVLGPAEDGGYYLIGMHKPYDVFNGIPMSTEVVFQMTWAKAHEQGLKIEQLPTLFDIDELSELLRLDQLLQTNPTLAPVTAHQLQLLKQERTLQP